MKTINEIFETNPSLLETKEVQELIEQFRIQFEAAKRGRWVFWDKVTSLTMNSELFVLYGMPCREVVKKINELSFSDKMLP